MHLYSNPCGVNQGVAAAYVVPAPGEGCLAGTELLTLIFLLLSYLQHIPSTLPAICFLMVKHQCIERSSYVVFLLMSFQML